MVTQHIRTVYDQIKAKGQRSGVCTVCGKSGKRQRTFSQTNSPFNRHPDGTQRTDDEIYKDVREQARAWSKEPFVHPKCE